MRVSKAVFLLTAACVYAASEEQPAELRVSTTDGSLSYQVVNKSPSRITEFEVVTTWREGDLFLSCSVHYPNVRSQQDLHVTAGNTCTLPADPNLVRDLKSTIRRLRFANGFVWSSPANSH